MSFGVEGLIALVLAKMLADKNGGGGSPPPVVWPSYVPPSPPPGAPPRPPAVKVNIPPGVATTTTTPGPNVRPPPVTIPPAAVPPAAPPPPPPPVPPPPPPPQYTIRSGDFPSGLSARATGDATRWRELEEPLNPGMTSYTDGNGATQLHGWSVGRAINVPPGWNL